MRTSLSHPDSPRHAVLGGSVIRVAARHPYLECEGPLAIAHRGGALEAAENTRSGFEYAVSVGYRHLETDVQVTSDGVAVLFHDDVLDRVTDATGRVSGLRWSDVRNVGTPAGTDQIMRLDHALEAFPNQCFNLDLKSEASVDVTLAVLASVKCYDRVLLGAFSDARLETVRRRVGPILATSAGPGEVLAYVAASRGLPFPRTPRSPHAPLALQIPISMYRVPILSRRLVEYAHGLGIQVHMWTIDDEAEMRRLLDLGVDGILTDRPAALRTVLKERGEWFDHSS